MFRTHQQIGSYTLIKRIGSGGFGEVWLAKDSNKPTSKYALKLSHKDRVDSKQIAQEIGHWVLSGKHPNVLPLIGAKIFGGQIAIISEYASDGSLQDLLNGQGSLANKLKRESKLTIIWKGKNKQGEEIERCSLSIEEAVKLTVGILEGLAHLHESGIIHRDLKPANILLSGKTPRLSDFGISRIITTDSLSETVSGTWAYMAPECFDGKRNVQTDIWSIGVILYRMLTGNLPFPQKEQTALIGAIHTHEPEPLSTSNPIALQNIISKALAKSPMERYQTAEQMHKALQLIPELSKPTKRETLAKLNSSNEEKFRWWFLPVILLMLTVPGAICALIVYLASKYLLGMSSENVRYYTLEAEFFGSLLTLLLLEGTSENKKK
ncbi:MAG TPA: serine/threonine-protein kinase [Pyrinomonadaceae bacterium]|jgi:serine/threonine-protein kinase